MSRYKIYYNKGLKMSPEKLASQVSHITLCLGYWEGYTRGSCSFLSDLESAPFIPKDQTIIVLGLSNKKFNEMVVSCEKEYPHYHKQVDLGLTEVEEGTETAFGFIEE